MDLQTYKTHFQQNDAFSNAIGICVADISTSHAEVVLDMTDAHRNYMGMLHGGVIFTMADIAAGLCVAANGIHCVTLNSSINYLQSAHQGKITARAEIARRGRRVSVCDVRVTSDDDILLATASFTMYSSGKEIEF